MGVHVTRSLEEETCVEGEVIIESLVHQKLISTILTERMEEDLGSVEETNLGAEQKAYLGRGLQENIQNRAAKVLRRR